MSVKKSSRSLLHDPVDLPKLLDALSFTDEEVGDAALEQAKLYLEAARYRIQCLRNKNAKTSAAEVTQATAELAVRRRLKEEGDKVTEGQVKAIALKKPSVQEALAAQMDAEEEDEFSKLLLEAFRQRRAAIETIQYLMGSEVAAAKLFSGEVSDKLKSLREGLRKKYPGKRNKGEDDDE